MTSRKALIARRGLCDILMTHGHKFEIVVHSNRSIKHTKEKPLTKKSLGEALVWCQIIGAQIISQHHQHIQVYTQTNLEIHNGNSRLFLRASRMVIMKNLPRLEMTLSPIDLMRFW